MPESTKVKWLTGGAVEVVRETAAGTSWTKKVRGHEGLTLKEASILLGVSNTSVWKWVRSGQLTAKWMEQGKKYIVTVTELRRYARDNGLFVKAGN